VGTRNRWLTCRPAYAGPYAYGAGHILTLHAYDVIPAAHLERDGLVPAETHADMRTRKYPNQVLVRHLLNDEAAVCG